MTDPAAAQASLELTLKDEILFRKDSTQGSAGAYGVEAVMMTATKPAPA